MLEQKICAIKYVGKNDTEFNIRINNNRKGYHDPKAIRVLQHFALSKHYFSGDIKFTIIEQIHKENIRNNYQAELRKKRKSTLISKLDTLKTK